MGSRDLLPRDGPHELRFDITLLADFYHTIGRSRALVSRGETVTIDRFENDENNALATQGTSRARRFSIDLMRELRLKQALRYLRRMALPWHSLVQMELK